MTRMAKCSARVRASAGTGAPSSPIAREHVGDQIEDAIAVDEVLGERRKFRRFRDEQAMEGQHFRLQREVQQPLAERNTVLPRHRAAAASLTWRVPMA